jgi:hypothetical protein
VLVVPANPRADTIPAVGDTVRPAPDTVSRPAIPLPQPKASPFDSLTGDTLRAPTARSEAIASPMVGAELRWDRTELFASGALTLDDLLEPIVGVTTFTSGWLVAPRVASLGGDFTRVRVYHDGVELDRMDPVFGGTLDLSHIPIWTLEEVAVERVAGELRVHLRSWRTRNTTPRTRTDIFTGDRQTEIFRGLFGQRYRGGWGLQLGGQALSTVDNRLGGGGDQSAYIARFAWAKGLWSVDTYGIREQHRRGETRRLADKGDALPPRGTRFTNGYARVAYGDPDSGPWAQLMASGLGLAETDPPNDSMPARAARRMQYVAAAGRTYGPFRLSVTERMRVFGGETFHSPSLRAAYARPMLDASAFAERDGLDSLTRVDVTARLTPFRWLSLLASGRRASSTSDSVPDATDLLGEVGLRLRGALWLSGGITTRDSSRLVAPRIFDTLYTDTADGRAQAVFLNVRGRLWKDIYTDIRGLRWSDSAAFRPMWESRSEIGVRTRWLARFPTGSFSLHASIAHEYRSGALFPKRDGSGAVSMQNSGDTRSITTLLEIRILSAVATWQYRNPFGSYNEQVPGFILPRRQNLYGVRWDWYN